jgi:hypothetical protein
VTINRDLRVEQIRPLLFAIAKHFSVQEAKAAIRLAVFWSVRFLIVGGRGGLLDRNYAQRAQEIASGKIKTAAALKTALADIIPSDALFEAGMAEARISQNVFARYLLRAMELKAKGEPAPENIPNDEENIINLEHILPENPDKNWPAIDSETASVMFKRLGNMVLLQAKKNVLVGNSKFDDKKPNLKSSAFLLTSQVADYPTWGATQIKERQTRLAALAVQTWPIT